MASFAKAIPIILKNEGGFVNNVNDAGGATNMGISLRWLQTLPLSEGDINKDGKIDINDIKTMTAAAATQLYKRNWWDKYGYDKLSDTTIATKIFDYAVNMGAKRAHILVQTAMNKTFNSKLVVDGVAGTSTFAAVNSIATFEDRQRFIDALSNEAWLFYQNLVASKPSNSVFLKGWKTRAFSISKADSIN